MNYALGYAFNIHDMFANFDTSKLDSETKKCEELIGNRHKEVIAKKVFKYAVKLVIDDVINNSARFELPTGGKKSFIAMKKLIKKPIGNREIMRNYFSTIGLVPIMKSKKRC